VQEKCPTAQSGGGSSHAGFPARQTNRIPPESVSENHQGSREKPLFVFRFQRDYTPRSRHPPSYCATRKKRLHKATTRNQEGEWALHDPASEPTTRSRHCGPECGPGSEWPCA